MTLIDPENFRRASTLVHVFQGAALLVLGAAEAYAADARSRKIDYIPPAAFILGGALMLGGMLSLLGGWELQGLRDALEIKAGFYIFPALAWFFAAAGMCRMLALYMGEKGRFWHVVFPLFLCAIGALYFVVPFRVSETARQLVLPAHAAMGITLIAAVLFKALNFFLKKKALQIAWAVLLLITAGQLLIYREIPQAFEYQMVNIQATTAPPAQEAAQAPAPAPKKNAKPVNKKRPSH